MCVCVFVVKSRKHQTSSSNIGSSDSENKYGTNTCVRLSSFVHLFFYWKKIDDVNDDEDDTKWNWKNPSSVKSVVKIDDDDEKQIKINKYRIA